LGRRKYRTKDEQIKWIDKKKIRISKWRGKKVCSYCGKRFKYTSKNIHQTYCSVICQVKSRAYEIDENFFNKISSEGKAYLLGLIFADGNISKNGNRINISSNDKNLIEICRKLLKTNAPIHRSQNNFSLFLGNPKIYESLRRNGVLPRKSWKEYSIPKIPENLRWHFLRGVFDGDGSFYIDDRGKWKYLCASLCCGSGKFLQEIKEWLEKQNIKTQNIRFDRKTDNKGCWQLRITSREAIKKFTNYLYKNSNYFLNRKYKIVKTFYA
jgi:intein-encoded DNA endonuclease-like protein